MKVREQMLSQLLTLGISATSEGDFSASNNATKLSFRTAVSESCG